MMAPWRPGALWFLRWTSLCCPDSSLPSSSIGEEELSPNLIRSGQAVTAADHGAVSAPGCLGWHLGSATDRLGDWAYYFCSVSLIIINITWNCCETSMSQPVCKALRLCLVYEKQLTLAITIVITSSAAQARSAFHLSKNSNGPL